MAQRGRPPGPDRVPFPLRAEKAILDAVKRCALADLRSVNAEIEMLLREALARRGIRIKPAGEENADSSGGRPPSDALP
jgi:hypothetical protein